LSELINEMKKMEIVLMIVTIVTEEGVDIVGLVRARVGWGAWMRDTLLRSSRGMVRRGSKLRCRNLDHSSLWYAFNTIRHDIDDTKLIDWTHTHFSTSLRRPAYELMLLDLYGGHTKLYGMILDLGVQRGWMGQWVGGTMEKGYMYGNLSTNVSKGGWKGLGNIQ
jgi:hypothetical protein